MTGRETIHCPYCQGELKPYDRRKRVLLDHNGKRWVFSLRRLRCQKCKRMHIELPDIFIPYKRYSAAVIESVIEEKTSGAPYEERTRQKICSWYRRVKSHLLGVWQQQVKLGLASPGFIPHLVSLVRAAVNSGNWLYHPFGRFHYAFSPL
ncbi:DUF6431 domain-containing protein [Candidatus Sordicultor fermentans]|uniref:DUF6431 domain-containing protein n=1 Tax=Candidatus Sordicultor fermentans TaxID=1953203 RepID=UPI001690FD83|nr:hypothetical protein [Candidatus Atribacteria bacterium]